MDTASGGGRESPGGEDERELEEFVEQLEGRAMALSLQSGEAGREAGAREGRSSRGSDGRSDAAPKSPGAAAGDPRSSDRDEAEASNPGTDEAMEEAEGSGRQEGGRGKGRRTPHQMLLSRLSQRRYRERQKKRKLELEAMATDLANKSGVLEHLEQENAMLRAMNHRFETMLREQQAFITALQGGQPAPPVAYFDPTAAPPGQPPYPRQWIHGPGAPPAMRSAPSSFPRNAALSGFSPMLSPPAPSWAASPFWSPQARRTPAWPPYPYAPHYPPLPFVPSYRPPSPVGFGAPPSSVPPQVRTGAQGGSAGPSCGRGDAPLEEEQDFLLSSPAEHSSPPVSEGPISQNPGTVSAGETDLPNILEGQPTSLAMSMPFVESFSESDPAFPYGGNVAASSSTAGGLATEMATQILALKNFLVANAIFMGGIQPSEEVSRALGTMLSSAVEVAISIVRSRVPLPTDLARVHLQTLDVELSQAELSKFETCLVILNLSRTQKNAILELRSRQMACLRGLHEERARLNDQARTLLRELGGSAGRSEEMKQVWNALKQNVVRENGAAVDGLQSLLFGILDPIQGALLVVDAGPEGVDVIKLATAVAALQGDSSGGTTEPGSSPHT